MKAKIFSSVLSLAVAGAFWACNDDSVITIASADQGGVVENNSSKTKDDSSAKSSSSEDVIVVHKSSASKATDPSSSTDVLSSESANPTLNVTSSSSVELIIISGRSSSSVTVIDNPVASSASIVVPVTGLGSCAPTKNPINKGETTTWKFSGNLASGQSVGSFIKASFAWTFSSNAVSATGMAGGSTSAPVTYTVSGAENASVVVTMPDGSSEAIQCSPLQVNGDPITGCACNASATTIDYTAEPSVSWAVTGCTSASNIISYTWDGVEGTAAFTKAFDAPVASYAPTLKVANEDNTVIDVACQAVRATEGPEYVFKLEGDFPSLSDRRIEVPSGSCMSIRGYWNNQYFTGSFKILCSMDAGYTSINSSGVSFLMTYEGKEICYVSRDESSYWGFSNEGGYIGEMKKGDISYDNICVEFTGAETVTCEIGY